MSRKPGVKGDGVRGGAVADLWAAQVIDEGNETDDFWFVLGGRGPIKGANEAVADEIAEGMRDVISPIPSPRKTPPNCAIVGGGVAAGACAKYLCDCFGIQVVVFESEDIVGGRMGHATKSGVPFCTGASYFHAAGPHIRGQVQGWIEAGIVGEWKPRVGVVTAQSYGSDTLQGFTPAMHTLEEEINVEAWLENRPKTGVPRHANAGPRPATAFHNPIDNISVHPLQPPTMPHRRSGSLNLARGHGSHSW